MNSRMSTFETTITEKIDKLETNYTELNTKIDGIK